MVATHSPQLACCLYLLLQLTAPFAKTPLSDRILHYEPLSYETEGIHEAYERIRRGEPSVGELHKKPVRLSFAAFERNFTLLLWQNMDVFAPNARFLFHGKDGVRPADYDPATFFRGVIEGDSSSRVHGHLVNGVFDGVIKTGDGEEFHVEAAKKYFREKREGFHSVIYSVRDVVFNYGDHNASCGLKDELLKRMQKIASTAKPDPRTRQRRSPRWGSSTLADLFSGTGSHSHSKAVPRTDTVSGGLFCQVRVAADHLFVENVGGGSESATVSEIASVFASVQSIFQSTDFDQNGIPDSITPQLVQTDILDSSAPGYLFNDGVTSVNEFLDLWSTLPHDGFCLALLLTYRDFADGILGLAWVGAPPGGTRGGICDSNVTLTVGLRHLNSAVVTYLNFGSTQPRAVTMVTIAHEIGHNFGSPHDPDIPGDTCSPGSSQGGNYIMYPRATDGNLENNILFSPCSVTSIYGVITTKSDCFQLQNSFCGNLIVEEGEECDCGETEEQCRNVDNCCMADMCVLKPGAMCSETQGCCTPECTIVEAGTVCFNRTECANSSFCGGGNDPKCPDPEAINAPCMGGLRFCENGECTGSICLTVGLSECQCTGDERELCHVCCMDGEGSDCISTFTLEEMDTIKAGQYREQGRSCNNYQGYCNSETPPQCITVDNEQTLDDLLDIFSIDTLNAVLAWFQTYWWIVVIVIVVVIVVIVLLHLTYRRKKIIRHRRRMSTIRGASGQAAGGAEAGPGSRAQQRRESIQLLNRFFPDCGVELIESVLRSARSEPKAVKQLLSLGYPLKKIPMPRLP